MMFLITAGGIAKFLLNMIYVVACIALIGLIVVRQGETGGLSTAFGGPGEAFLGARAQKTIDKVIIWCAVTYVFLSIALNLPTIQRLGM